LKDIREETELDSSPRKKNIKAGKLSTGLYGFYLVGEC
jgi:hypothetical protein